MMTPSVYNQTTLTNNKINEKPSPPPPPPPKSSSSYLPCISSRTTSSPSAPPLWSVIGSHGSIPQNHCQQQNNSIMDSLRSNLENIHQSIKNKINNNTLLPPNNNNHVLPTFLAGTCAFYCTAFASTYIQWKFLKMSTGTRPSVLPMTMGAMTIAMGSWMGHLAGVGTVSALNAVGGSVSGNGKLTSFFDKEQNNVVILAKQWGGNLVQNAPIAGEVAWRSAREMTRPMRVFGSESMTRHEKRERKEAWMHAARICVIGLLTYKTIFRSHFASISPSSYTARGSFARMSIPAPPNFNYATQSQRKTLEQIGKWWGCHTCGSRMMFSNIAKTLPKFHGDHIPPVSVAKQINSRWYRQKLGWKVSQKFYPQCRDCSNKQGGMLSKAVNAGHRNLHAVGGGEESYFHGGRLRIGHLTGGVVAALTVGSAVNGGEEELVESSRERVFSYQVWVEDVAKSARLRVEDFFRGFR